MPLTKLSLGGNNDVIYKLFPPRGSLVSDISGTGISKSFFYGVPFLEGKLLAGGMIYMILYEWDRSALNTPQIQRNSSVCNSNMRKFFQANYERHECFSSLLCTQSQPNSPSFSQCGSEREVYN
jgi:hypothetical protein